LLRRPEKPNWNASAQGFSNVLANERLFLPTVDVAVDLLRFAHGETITQNTHMTGKCVYQDFGTAKAPLGSKLTCMTGFPHSIRTVFVIFVLFARIYPCSAQSPTVRANQENAAVLITLSPPVYPPIASTARIKGDIELLLNIRRDGSVESAVVISGPPLLQQSALNSARQSKFECLNCTEGLTPYHLLYTFQLVLPTDAFRKSHHTNKLASTGLHLRLPQESPVCEMPLSLEMWTRLAI
jgi:hypothetical protein